MRLPPAFVQILIAHMKSVQHAMRDRREQQAHERNENQPAEQGVERSKEFCAIRFQFIHRSHARENHGCIQQRIDPRQPRNKMIANDAYAQGESDESDGDLQAREHTPDEFTQWQNLFVAAFEHAARLARLIPERTFAVYFWTQSAGELGEMNVMSYSSRMTEMEKSILDALLELERAVEAMSRTAPKPDLRPHFSRLDEMTRALPPTTDSLLLHYLHKQSYEKARLFLQGRDAENQVGNCRHVDLQGREWKPDAKP